jgi:hypothetical protein
MDSDDYRRCVHANETKLIATQLITCSCLLRSVQSRAEHSGQFTKERALPVGPLGSGSDSWDLCDIHRKSNSDVNRTFNLHCALRMPNNIGWLVVIVATKTGLEG